MALVYDSFGEGLCHGSIAPSTDTYKVLLVDERYVPDKGAHANRSQVIGEIRGPGFLQIEYPVAVQFAALSLTAPTAFAKSGSRVNARLPVIRSRWDTTARASGFRPMGIGAPISKASGHARVIAGTAGTTDVRAAAVARDEDEVLASMLAIYELEFSS